MTGQGRVCSSEFCSVAPEPHPLTLSCPLTQEDVDRHKARGAEMRESVMGRVQSGWVVRAVERNGNAEYLIGVYGPFVTRSAAEVAAERHNRNGVKTDVMPLHAPEVMGTW
jgi:hypothetical protein